MRIINCTPDQFFDNSFIKIMLEKDDCQFPAFGAVNRFKKLGLGVN